MKQFLLHINRHKALFILIIFFSFLFFFRMHWPALGSWDEAWYGSIAREMVKSGDFMHSNWNGKPFYDHPPMGFWIMALSYYLFGISEFTTRLPSVLMGIGTIVILYLTGILLFKKKVIGFAAALILGTSVWYVIRVRSGNLDSPFLFFYVLTIYSALKSAKNIRFFPLTGLAFGALMMTKTLVGASALPVIGVVMIPQLWKLKKNIWWLLIGIFGFLLVTIPWYVLHILSYPDFINHHFLEIGTRNKTAGSYFELNYVLPLFYLHMGVRKWYYLWSLSLVYLVFAFQFLKRNVFIIIFWNLVVLYPFLTTDQTHIWHLIPVYAPLALITAYGLWSIGSKVVEIVQKIPIPFIRKLMNMVNDKVITVFYIIAVLIIAGMQIKVFYPEVFPANRYISDEVDITQKAGRYDSTIFLDDDYLPMAVFYSGRFMRQMSYEPTQTRTLVNLFESKEKDFIVITRKFAINNLSEQNLEYRILEENNSFVILTRP